MLCDWFGLSCFIFGVRFSLCCITFLVLFFFFFFQAEDGIRDADVTGVQTCALPILKWARYSFIGTNPFLMVSGKNGAMTVEKNGKKEIINNSPIESLKELLSSYRSEERRVGKECRSRWWQDHYKKK